jgi:peptide/nickel transport system substrate-binding protein
VLGCVGTLTTVMSLAFGAASSSAAGSVSAIARSHNFIDLATSVTPTLDEVNNNSVTGEYQVDSWVSTLVRPSGATTPGSKLPGMNDVRPSLATSWKVTPTGVIFNLRKGVKSSWGNTLSSADVVWSFERACSQDFGAGFYLNLANADISTDAKGVTTCPNLVKVLGPDKVEIVQKSSSPYTLGEFTEANLQIFDSTEAKLHATSSDPWAEKWLADNTASYGPYAVTSGNFIPNQKLVLTLNPNYYAKKSVYYTKVVLDATTNDSVALQELESGAASHDGSLTYQEFNSAVTSPHLSAYLLPDGNTERVSFFLKFAPWRNLLVRKAISEAINRAAIVHAVFRGDASVDCYPLPASFTLTFSDPCDELYNPADAKALLAKAGFTKSHPFTFTMATTEGDTGPYITSEMQLVQSQLAAVGVKMKIDIVPNVNTYNTEDYPPHVAYEATLDAGGGAFADGGLTEELLFNTNIYPNQQLEVQGFHNSAMFADVVQMLKTKSKAVYDRDEKNFALTYASQYMQANVVSIPQQVVTAKGITGYESYAQPILYYDLLHPAS